MKTFNQPLTRYLKLSALLLIIFCASCKKDHDSGTTPKKSAVFFGGQDGNFYALNAQTGDLLWKYQSSGNFSYSTPVMDNKTIYTTNTDYNLYALDAVSGTVRWMFSTKNTTISSPAISNGVVYFGSDDHYIYAVDATTGNLKWKYLTNQNVDSSPVVANGIVYIGSADNYLYALDAANGTLKWKYDTGNIIVESSPVISNNVVFIGNRSGILSAIDANSGALKWAFNDSNISLEQSRFVINNGVIYMASWYNTENFNLGGSLFAIRESDGSKIWESLKGLGFSSGPTYADGKLYVNSDDTNLYAVDAATGNTLWAKPILANGSIPTVANGKVYAGGGGSRAFHVFDATTGNESWQLALTNSITTSKPLVVVE